MLCVFLSAWISSTLMKQVFLTACVWFNDLCDSYYMYLHLKYITEIYPCINSVLQNVVRLKNKTKQSKTLSTVANNWFDNHDPFHHKSISRLRNSPKTWTFFTNIPNIAQIINFDFQCNYYPPLCLQQKSCWSHTQGSLHGKVINDDGAFPTGKDLIQISNAPPLSACHSGPYKSINSICTVRCEEGSCVPQPRSERTVIKNCNLHQIVWKVARRNPAHLCTWTTFKQTIWSIAPLHSKLSNKTNSAFGRECASGRFSHLGAHARNRASQELLRFANLSN